MRFQLRCTKKRNTRKAAIRRMATLPDKGAWVIDTEGRTVYELKEIVDDLSAVLNLTRLLSSDCTLDEILHLVLEATTEIMQSDRSSLFILDEDKNELFSRIAQGAEIAEIRFPADKGIAGSVAQTGRTVNIPDCYADTRFNSDFDRQTGYRTRNMLAVPMKTFEGKIIGVVEVMNRKQGVYGEYDEYLLELLGAHAGVSIERAMLIEHFMQKKRLESEMNIAHDIQDSLTPRQAPAVDGFEISCFSRQCQRTGGDYLDFMSREDGKLAVIVGDVTGHGLGAALLMMVARSAFRALLQAGSDMAEAARKLNNQIHQDSRDGRCLTLFYSILDPETRELRYVNCGHDAPVWYHAREGTFSMLDSSGLPVGIIAGADYEEGPPVRLEENDILLVLTDGIIEAMDGANAQFGYDRLKDVIKEYSDRLPTEIIQETVLRIKQFCGTVEQQDDMTVMIMKVNPPRGQDSAGQTG